MRMGFLALVCAAMVLLGCKPVLTAREVCYGECATRDASAADRSACRSSCSTARENVVGVEYAGFGVPLIGKVKKRPPGPDQWTCWGIAEYMHSTKRVVFRAMRNGENRQQAFARTLIRGLAPQREAYVQQFGDVAFSPLPVYGPKTQPREWDVECSDTGVPPDAVHYWPPETAFIKSPSGAKAVPAALTWSPQPAARLDSRYCRQWDRALQSFGAIPIAGDTGHARYDCSITLTYRPLVQMSDGKELGAPTSIGRHERDLCGPVTNARAGVEAALRHQAGPDVHVVDYVGDCAEER